MRPAVVSNQKAFPLELKVHAVLGKVIGASVRTVATELLWVDHEGRVHAKMRNNDSAESEHLVVASRLAECLHSTKSPLNGKANY